MEKQALAVREQQWYQTITTAKESGQSIKSWCAENGVLLSSFYNWQRKMRSALLPYSSGLLYSSQSSSARCTGVEDELDVTMAQRSELDYLIYNDPLGYADLILNGDPERYLKNMAGSHGLEI